MIKEANSVWRFFFSGLLCAKLILCACKEWNVCNFCGHTVYGNRLENKTFWLWNMTGEQQDGCVCVYVFPCLYKASAHWRISGYICIIKNRNIISTVEQQQQLDIVPTLNTMTILQECTFLLNFTDNKRIKKKNNWDIFDVLKVTEWYFREFWPWISFHAGNFFSLVTSKFNRSILKISGFFGSQNKQYFLIVPRNTQSTWLLGSCVCVSFIARVISKHQLLL